MIHGQKQEHGGDCRRAGPGGGVPMAKLNTVAERQIFGGRSCQTPTLLQRDIPVQCLLEFTALRHLEKQKESPLQLVDSKPDCKCLSQ